MKQNITIMNPEGRPTTETLDARWFPRFKELFFEDYEKLTGAKEIREEEKRRFLAGETENPTLDYPELETFKLDEREEKLLALKEDVIEREGNEIVKKIYRTKLNELIATVRMLRATKSGDDRRFARYATFIYGKPGGDDLQYVVQAAEEAANAKLESGTEDEKAAAERLLGVLGHVERRELEGATKDILPKGEERGGIVTVEVAVKAFTDALAELGADQWNVVVDSEKGISNFSVSQEDEIVRIPSREKLEDRKITVQKMKGLIAHEIGKHVAGRVHGEDSRLQLLGLGLDRYLKGEEGVATYNEQLVTGAKEFAGVARYFSVAVAKGLGGESRDFRQTFEVMRDYRMVTQNTSKTPVEKAATTAYNDCVRIFRGSTGKTPGAVYAKDMAYFGNRDVWTLVSKDSDVVKTFAIGKFDPTNERHVVLLSKLGILDSDLVQLES